MQKPVVIKTEMSRATLIKLLHELPTSQIRRHLVVRLPTPLLLVVLHCLIFLSSCEERVVSLYVQTQELTHF